MEVVNPNESRALGQAAAAAVGTQRSAGHRTGPRALGQAHLQALLSPAGTDTAVPAAAWGQTLTCATWPRGKPPQCLPRARAGCRCRSSQGMRWVNAGEATSCQAPCTGSLDTPLQPKVTPVPGTRWVLARLGGHRAARLPTRAGLHGTRLRSCPRQSTAWLGLFICFHFPCTPLGHCTDIK